MKQENRRAGEQENRRAGDRRTGEQEIDRKKMIPIRHPPA